MSDEPYEGNHPLLHRMGKTHPLLRRPSPEPATEHPVVAKKSAWVDRAEHNELPTKEYSR